MALHSNSHVLTERAIRAAYRQAIDAYTVEDALRYHSELIDLLAAEAMIVRASALSESSKKALIRDINARAEHHCEAVDRLTDIIEGSQRLTWRRS